MRKSALLIVTTAVIGALGMFLRWLQMQNVLEPAGNGNTTMLVAHASGYSTVVLVAMVCFVVLSVFFAVWMKKGLKVPEKPAPPRFHNIAQPVFAGVACVLLLAGSVLMMGKGASNRSFSWMLMGFLFFLCVGAVARLTLVKRNVGGKYFAAFCAAFVAVVMSVWLIFAYKENAEDPQLWLFVPGILAVASSALGFYYLAGYPFGRAKPARTLFVGQLAVYFNLMAAAYPSDPPETATARTFIFIALALLFLVESWAVAEQG